MSAHSLIGHQLDEYSVVQLLGQGGMARVYLAEDVRLKRRVALKVIEGISEPDIMRRFEQEAQAIARLEHPHIVRLYRYGEVNGLFYMAMQYIEGSTLAMLLEMHRRAGTYLDTAIIIRLLRDVCDALDYAHSQGVIHRDVKPSNILLDQSGRPYLADFGLARQVNVDTRGEVFGSVHYVAPEQVISSAKTVPQSDLYAVGVILYEMLTGQVPFSGGEPPEIALRHIDEKPGSPRELRPELPRRMEQIVFKALAKKPTSRYPDGHTLSAAVSSALGQREPRPSSDSAIPAPRVIAPPVVSPPHRRPGNRFVRYSISILVLIAILIPAGYYWLDVRNQETTLPASHPFIDRDRDDVPDADDKCPNQQGLPRLDGCWATGRIVIATQERNAYLRSGPGTKYATTGSVPRGSSVVVLGRNAKGDWLRVRPVVNDPDSDAWIAAFLVRLPQGVRIGDLNVIRAAD
jgi:serine/threonine protein kinase